MLTKSSRPTLSRIRDIFVGISILLILMVTPFLTSNTAQAANPNGGLRIEPFTAYNLIVDSNVETPATYAPEAFHIGAQFCNDNGTSLSDVVAYVGDYNGGSGDTPGVYSSRSHPGLTGTFSLTHLGGSVGTADAVRYIGDLAAGECRVQYWLVGYPRLDDNGNSVTLGIKPDDDLWLNYDLWATANNGALTAETTRRVTMRNEISAMANKIWPNTSSKVPNEFLQVVNDLGWSNPNVESNGPAYPGQTLVMEGIWYDLGNVRFGFDNNGDLQPDYNAWLQPIGDGDIYDPGCFRLVRTDAIVVVKLNDGTFDVRTAVDQLYFEDLPPNNTGAVGLVYYTFAALDGTCRGVLTPYQEVASGFDNEKFNGDYGTSIAPLESRDPDVSFDKEVDQTIIPAVPGLPSTLAYTLTFTNTGPVAIGDPTLGIPLVVQDSIPAGTTYVANSAAAGNVLPAGVTAYNILYSTDNGQTWSATQPAAASVTDLQWWLDAPLASGAGGTVTFDVTVPSSYPDPTVPNTGGLSFGNAATFLEDDTVTLVPGSNSIGDTVWEDDGGTSGILANGVQDGDEAGIPNVTVTLYYDANGDGALDSGDVLLATQSTNGSGNYLFDNLPDGSYLTVVDDSDTDLTTGRVGWIHTTPLVSASTDLGVGVGTPVADLDNDFGFAPALTGDKALQGTSPIYEGQEVNYTLTVNNTLPGNSSGQPASCEYLFWAQAEDADHTGSGNKAWTSPANVFGSSPRDFLFASSDYAKGSNNLIAGDTFVAVDDGGTIVKVEAIFPVYLSQTLVDDYAIGSVFYNTSGSTALGTQTLTTAMLNQYVGLNHTGLIAWDITALRAWAWADFALVDLQLEAQKTSAADAGMLYLDAMGIRITTSNTCGSPDQTMDPVPMTDTYDATKLEFVSADPPVSSSTPGTLTWDNVGPLHAGGSETIVVTFKALEPPGNATTTVTNTMSVTNAFYVNGKPTNSITDSVPVTLEPTGTISGVVWSDLDGSGWASGTFGQGAGEPGIPGITMTLYSCTQAFANNDSCGGTETIFTTVTDNSGQYLFEGLILGDYYRVVSTAPSGSSQTGDPEDDNNNSPGNTGNYGTCGSGGSNAACDNMWLSDGDGSNGFQLGTEVWGGNSDDVTNINFGYENVPAQIYGNVWYDVNGDALQATTDNPFANVTVRLCSDAACTSVVDTTQTDANGDYGFSTSTAGNYYVVVDPSTLPAGASWSQTLDPDESGVCATCDSRTNAITVVLGNVYGSYDFAYTKSGTAEIGDTVYTDWNGDGTQDSEDEGIPGRTVTLYEDFNGDGDLTIGVDPLISTTVTAVDGTYLFSNLPAGDYLVVTTAPAGTIQTGDPDEPGAACATCDNKGASTGLATSGSDLTEDFGYRPYGTGSIGDTVWFDANGDGTQAGVLETGIVSITVSLYVDFNGDGTYVLLDTTETDGSGNYLFDELPAGDYRVVVDTNDTNLPVDAFGNRSVPSTPTSDDVTLTSGQNYLDADFGFVNLGAIGDTVYWDANNNGTQDWNEVGIPNVTVNLTNSSTVTDTDGTVYAPGTYNFSDVTDSSGKYLFDALPPGDYTVTVDSSDPDLGGAAQTADPDRDGENCESTTYPALSACDHATTEPISYGTSYMGADFGYQPTGVVGDFVFFDQDGDGIQDGTELGISGLVVTATLGGTVYTTTTDVDGYYLFQGLTVGSWTIEVEQPANMTATASSVTDLVDNGIGSVGSTSTSVTIDGTGQVTAIGGNSCTDCELNVDFGFEFNGNLSLTGAVCLEGGSNGSCEIGDTPVVTHTVYLYNDSNLLIAQTSTDASGAYTFTNLIPDGYYAVVGTQTPVLSNTSLNTTLANTGANAPGVNGDTDPVTGVTETVASSYQLVTVDGTTAGGDNTVVEVDFSFSSTVNYDYGDLPDSYSTDLNGSPSGPRHVVPGSPSLYLGTAPDTEIDGAPSPNADGDGADEDGVAVAGDWTNGTSGGQLQIDITGGGWLVGWVDFNRDGDFYDSGEMVINQAVSSGQDQNFTFDVPAGTFDGISSRALSARFRLFESEPAFATVAFTGDASAGEVEDYIFPFGPTAVTLLQVESQAPVNSPLWLWLTSVLLLLTTTGILLGRRLFPMRP
ncbi:MAG: SdrD B-like domain-containing protein [Ardenticatenaceae bacterium]|nr:SdrD B-like domain-containing protein [Ardenticatenaceae bacterium]